MLEVEEGRSIVLLYAFYSVWLIKLLYWSMRCLLFPFYTSCLNSYIGKWYTCFVLCLLQNEVDEVVQEVDIKELEADINEVEVNIVDEVIVQDYAQVLREVGYEEHEINVAVDQVEVLNELPIARHVESAMPMV